MHEQLKICIYAYPVIFWVPFAGVRWMWPSDPCLITKTKQLENTVNCLYLRNAGMPSIGIPVNSLLTICARLT